MIIKQMYNEDKVKSNKVRLYNIKSLKHKGVDEVFLKLYGGIMNANFSAVKDILQNELYFEVIDDILVQNIINKVNYENCDFNKLKEYYILKAEKGIRFCWGQMLY